ncbi:hypothetical protein M409DRAFT_52014 [Zasmidium cellare ATCC 36951]|uniref:Uncharacterized protein n=1 Tax=Zasmidium cellare ATCC 36951 TaxID=1080233 RepID=A0A6A6CWU8_ZASCE|nr:uncharacterized protein M409DRAFT_52014 [Zasmidium cellare ATCC 36951]KAF2170279.1 hypothetical protein M409DRAFT_52014 [Zasmidium cellare ATCC 36951]
MQQPLDSNTSANRSISPHNSSTPLISERQRQDLRQAGNTTAAASSSSPAAATTTTTTTDEKDPKKKRLPLFGLGKKKEEKQQSSSAMDAPAAAPPTQPGAVASAQKQSQLQQQQQPDLKPTAQPVPVSPSRLPYQPAVAASPSRLRSASPRLHSPASSEIFERNVQEPVPISTLGNELSPAHIPSHVITEDSIPPALEASAQAITSESLNPDEVEIVTSSSHQPAATVLEPSASHADLTSLNSPPALLQQKSEESEMASSLNLHQAALAPGAEDDSASNYGQLDPNDVRRLSFISFKDIVHSEHQQMAASSLGEVGSRDSLHIANLPSTAGLPERAASPLRSPRSPNSTHSHTLSSGLSTPPPGAGINHPLSSTHADQSPVRSIGIGSTSSSQHGELTIETMRQALRKTASGDLSSGRSAGMSPVSDENSVRNEPRSRTNT